MVLSLTFAGYAAKIELENHDRGIEVLISIAFCKFGPLYTCLLIRQCPLHPPGPHNSDLCPESSLVRMQL